MNSRLTIGCQVFGKVCMLSFVWSDPLPIYSGRGGSENFTIGHVRELLERGIDARIITVGLGEKDGRQFFPDIPFYSVSAVKELEKLDDTLFFISRPQPIKTKGESFVIFHTQPPANPNQRTVLKHAIRDKIIIVNSRFSRKLWSEYFSIPASSITVVYPFADPAFGRVKRPKRSTDSKRVEILYAGRLTPEKGIYTLLQALHHEIFRDDCQVSVTTAGNQTEDGEAIERFLRHHSWVKVVDATHTPTETAKLFAQFQIVVIPSNPDYWTSMFGYWHETFGMISVEAQHAGCYVVASNNGGLLETDCGGLVLFESSNSYSLALAIQKIAKASPLNDEQRRQAVKHFTRTESVNALLAILQHSK